MKKQDILLGVIISSGISMIAILPRLLKMDSFNSSIALGAAIYFLSICSLFWFFISLTFNLNSLSVYNRKPWFIIIVINIAAGISVLFDSFYVDTFNPTLQFPEILGNKRFIIMWIRGMVLSGLFYFIQYYIYVLREKQKNQLELEQLKQAHLAANLSSLKEQISPHFLFNTLNTLSTLTEESLVKDYVTELANVYRYLLKYKDNDSALLEQELYFIGSYYYILKTRLEDALNITINIDKHLYTSKIPPLTLQMLIENAVKHNTASAKRPLSISITTTDDYYICVTNNLQPKTSVVGGMGVGLGNIIQRYQLLFNKDVIIEKSETEFTVKLPVI